MMKKILWNKNRIIKIGLYDYDSIKKYGDLKSITTDINQQKKHKNSLLIFHKTKYREEINEINDIINDMATI